MLLEELETKTKDFAKLKNGWHFWEGYAPSEKTINVALSLLRQAFEINFERVSVVPISEGGITITLYGKNDEEMEFYVDDYLNIELSYYKYLNDEDLVLPNVSFNETWGPMSWFKERQNNT